MNTPPAADSGSNRLTRYQLGSYKAPPGTVTVRDVLDHPDEHPAEAEQMRATFELAQRAKEAWREAFDKDLQRHEQAQAAVGAVLGASPPILDKLTLFRAINGMQALATRDNLKGALSPTLRELGRAIASEARALAQERGSRRPACEGRPGRVATNRRRKGSRRGATSATRTSRGDPDDGVDEPSVGSRLLAGGQR